ncbi:hypothetical protein [Paracnuella aquatica]|uniref:hypothetical protein n=1 Tax=Paracnuella aquatica TaxID=2268757 RepID=UPI000DEEDD7D|nr:hypothetical protein [Paracnuella aquatica]RPD43437.1 hypothetical protein DRJ53_20085 [Paracnuella aquatica]
MLETNNAGQAIQIGEFALHLQSPWRFTSDTEILAGSLDLYEPVDENAEYDEHFDWDKLNGNLRDFKLQELIKTHQLTVISVVADNFGGFDLLFSNDIRLSVFPAYSKVDQYSEHWRLLNNKVTDKTHFVVSGSSVLKD